MRLRTLLEKHGRVGLGGEGILRTYGRAGEAPDVITEALDQGITYFDSAHVYVDSEVYYGSMWREQPEVRARVFQASKSATRDREGALADLESVLERMGTEYLDLWQIHDVRTPQDLDVLSFDVSMAIVGCSTREEVKTLAGIRRETAPPDETERARIVKKFKPYASQLAFAGGVV